MADLYAAEANVWLMIWAILSALHRLAAILQEMHMEKWFVPEAVYQQLLHYANLQKINGAVDEVQ